MENSGHLRNTDSGPEIRCPDARNSPFHNTTATLRVCSACAGDYEDPERTAGFADDEADWGDAGRLGVTQSEAKAENQDVTAAKHDDGLPAQ